jgi:hypothetical protein
LFRDVCLFTLGVILAGSFVSYVVTGEVFTFFDVNPHPLACRMMIMWFAPLSIAMDSVGARWAAAWAMLAASWGIFLLSQLRSAVLMPALVLIMASILRLVRVRILLIAVIGLAAVIVPFFKHLPPHKIGKEFEPAYYRAENYAFSFHLALNHPVLGIGLRSNREEFLHNYNTLYPYMTRENFAASVSRIRTSENIFLTFMAEVGFPFLFLYTGCLLALMFRLIREIRAPSQPIFFRPEALFLPLAAAIAHFMIFDGLLHPQVSWFFHLLLGLIPTNCARAAVGEASGRGCD